MRGNVLRWLLASRDSRGVWGSTQNTFAVVDAMVDYLRWQHETESHFTLKGLLDGAEIFAHEFTSANIFKTLTHVIGIDALPRQKMLPLTFVRTNHTEEKRNFYYDVALKYFLPVAEMPPRDEGMTILRELFALTDTKDETPLAKAKVGDVVRGKITLVVPGQYAHVAVEDMIPAGFEIVNFNLATEDQSLQNDINKEEGYGNPFGVAPAPRSVSLVDRTLRVFDGIFPDTQKAALFGGKKFVGTRAKDPARVLHPSHVESHDDRVFLYAESLSPGVYEYEYFLRALVPGTFQYLPARAEELYFPEVFGRTSGGTFTVTE